MNREVWRIWYSDSFLDEHEAIIKREGDESDDYTVCPRCHEQAFHDDGVQQDSDGQYSHHWRCDACGYWEAL